jgi:hypothetical protein
LRGTLAAKTREVIFATFRTKLPIINTNASSQDITTWKKKREVTNCYNKLFKALNPNEKGSQIILSLIIKKVFENKEYSNSEV